MTDTSAALIWSPFPDRNAAHAAAKLLLKDKLIACANILPAVESVFEWEGECSSANEVGVLFKTTAELLDSATARLGECHPYDTPAILGWRLDVAHPKTLHWLGETLGNQ